MLGTSVYVGGARLPSTPWIARTNGRRPTRRSGAGPIRVPHPGRRGAARGRHPGDRLPARRRRPRARIQEELWPASTGSPTSAAPCRSSAPPAHRATTRCTRGRAKRPRRSAAPGSRSSPAAGRDHGGGQPRRARGRGAVDRPRHRAPARAVREPVRRHRPELPLLLHAQGHVRPLRERVRRLPGRVRDAGRAVRGGHAAPDLQDPPLPDGAVRLGVLGRARRVAARPVAAQRQHRRRGRRPPAGHRQRPRGAADRPGGRAPPPARRGQPPRAARLRSWRGWRPGSHRSGWWGARWSWPSCRRRWRTPRRQPVARVRRRGVGRRQEPARRAS